ncbi:SusD/RagB family nutrient-binding outer membrane lipoprotein [Pontibacter toksunensis]|uniref:SusD/RagB family nutrient-binding outer membrane lipoprotein n=1 Tax=Pontibacter toksunensis TaxID=1332631 RepID=A0ABW6BSB6_9BACT
MKKNILLYFLAVIGLVISTSSCSDDVLDEIDTNPNDPDDVSISLLIPQVTVNVPTAVHGVDLAWYSSVFVRHTAGVHAQLQEADRRTDLENPTLVNNVWNNIYAGVLPDLNYIIAKGSEGGSEEGSYISVGIAKILKAYTLSVATDAWGRVPYSQIGLGVENRQPVFDPQEEVYDQIFQLLNEAIADLDRGGPNPGSTDLIFNGNVTDWKRTAYSLLARYWLRLTNVNENAAQNALDAAQQGFQNLDDGFIFNSYENTAIGEHPWFQELNDRSHLAVSERFIETLDNLNDPRLDAMVAPVPKIGEIVGAPNATLTNDQANVAFSDVTSAVLNPTSPMPMMTYDELKFIEAEAYLRLGNMAEAFEAYQEGIRAAMTRQIGGSAFDDLGIDLTVAIDDYLDNPSLPQSPATLDLDDIIRQKWIAYFYFQPFEAYNDWRRTGLPEFITEHSISAPPLRFPYSLSERDANAINVPDVNIYTNGVWWDDGTED